jgi:hypothetical protein
MISDRCGQMRPHLTKEIKTHMAAISANYSFTPAVPGGSVTVSGNSETEIKNAVKATLTARRAAQQAGTDSIDTALTEMDS